MFSEYYAFTLKGVLLIPYGKEVMLMSTFQALM